MPPPAGRCGARPARAAGDGPARSPLAALPFDGRPTVCVAVAGLACRMHECRHTYVTLMDEAGFSLEEIGDYVGHSSSYMADRYRHLREGHEARAAERFDAFLAATGAETGAPQR